MTDQTHPVDLVPLALIAQDTGETVDALARRFGDAVQLDDIGMRAVAAREARRYFEERAALRARAEEDRRRRRAERKPVPAPAGVPAIEGLSAHETLMASPSYVSPQDEFSPFERPRFLEEQLAAGRRADAEKRRAVEERKR